VTGKMLYPKLPIFSLTVSCLI